MSGRRAAAVEAWTPANLYGVSAWWDASQITGKSDGDGVSVWPDASDNGNDLTSAGFDPTYKTGILGGKPVVRFTAANANEFFSTPSLTVEHMFAVVEYDAATFAGYDGLLTEYPTGQIILIGEGASDHFYNGTGTTTYHKDGTALAESNMTGPMGGAYGILSISAENWTNPKTWQIGRDRTQTSRLWNGDIAEIIMLDQTAGDVNRQLVEGYLAHKYSLAGNLPGDHPYKSAAPTVGFDLTDLVAHYTLDQGSQTRYDSHGSNDLSPTGTVGQTTGKLGDCAQFDGNTGYLSNAADNMPSGDIDFTICGWFYLNTSVTASKAIQRWNYTVGKRQWQVSLNDSKWFFVVSNDGQNAGSTNLYWGSDAALQEWQFVCAWHDSTANTLNLQVNDGTPVSAEHSGGCYDADSPMSIGQMIGNVVCYGRLDEVSIWNRLLTDAERTHLYNGGSGRTYPFGEAP